MKRRNFFTVIVAALTGLFATKAQAKKVIPGCRFCPEWTERAGERFDDTKDKFGYPLAIGNCSVTVHRPDEGRKKDVWRRTIVEHPYFRRSDDLCWNMSHANKR